MDNLPRQGRPSSRLGYPGIARGSGVRGAGQRRQNTDFDVFGAGPRKGGLLRCLVCFKCGHTQKECTTIQSNKTDDEWNHENRQFYDKRKPSNQNNNGDTKRMKTFYTDLRQKLNKSSTVEQIDYQKNEVVRAHSNWRDRNNETSPSPTPSAVAGQPNIKRIGPRPERTMGFQYVEKLVNNSENMQQVILDLSNDRNGFERLLDGKEMTNDMVVLLVKLLRHVCEISFQETKIALLKVALKSRFMEKLAIYVTSIMSQSERDRRCNRHFWRDPNDFWRCLLQFSNVVQEILPSSCEAIKTLINNLTIFLPLIESTQKITIPEEIKAETSSLLDLIEKNIKDMEVKKREALYNGPSEDNAEPPNDFRLIQIIPSAQEVVCEKSPFLRANIIDRAYNSVDQYLDIQFRLLREDFVAPLRRGISTFLSNQGKPNKDWTKLDDVKIYQPIRFLNIETVNECNCYKLRFDFTRKKRTFTYENSKRFMFGSLVCFTRDNFRTALFGKIVQRDVKLLEEGLLIVGFQENVEVNFDADYLMVESTVYFEPYYQVLGVLKTMNEQTFPMKKYIIKVEKIAAPPGYLLQDGKPIMYKVEEKEFSPLDFPKDTFYNLNESQMDAFKAALTDEFSIIQGPPGTGKTYLGLKIAHTLLNNHHAWYRNTPILVICYTNHALDQFLEGLLPVTEAIIRVGSQSKNEALQKYNLNEKRKLMKHQEAVYQRKHEVRSYMQHLKTLNQNLGKIEANDGLISLICFKDIIPDYRNSWFAISNSDQHRSWLLEGKTRDYHTIRQRQNQQMVEGGDANNAAANQQPIDDPTDLRENNNLEYLDDIFTGIVVQAGLQRMVTLKQLNDKLQMLHKDMEIANAQSNNLGNVLHREELSRELWELETDLEYLKIQLEFCEDPRNRVPPRHIDLRRPFNIPHEDRWRLYSYWVDQYKEKLRVDYSQSVLRFRDVYKTYNEIREIEDTLLMKQHRVVGMTTTGAARLQSSLQDLKSPIVIVEEAAEVLEAHIIASLTNHCQHLILIGDHLQLKPGAADYRVEKKFKLGISLFERMVRNNIKCHSLNVQHRMRPEISRLIKPHIYPFLQDHESTLQRPPILGVDTCLYFIDHQERENQCQDESKKNVHESTFLIALARHLILNGYKPDQITILAAYLGQFFEMLREKKKPINRMLLQDVRISVLDNYQGEECDIILLSLVRSNDDNKAGFLKIQNRVCVALSRARNGFYLMGNMSMLLNANSENDIWPTVKAVLEDQNAIGTHLTLRCQVHPLKSTAVSKSEDFDKYSEGGCDSLCNTPIPCGHICKRLCHVQDRDHALYRCNEKCTRSLCDIPDHPICQKLCYAECGLCFYPVSRTLDCGHTVDIACYIDPDKYECQVRVTEKLPCDHEVQKPCSADPEKFRCPMPCDTRVEPCGHPCRRSCHFRLDPDHLQYKCMEICDRPKAGCQETTEPHPCPKFCFDKCEECIVGVKRTRSCGHTFTIACKLNIQEEVCQKLCKKRLLCGHACKSRCSEPCKPCESLVEKVIPECNHTVKIKCHQEPQRIMCKAKKCPRMLPCGHKCTKSCRVSCTPFCKQFVECDKEMPCGHVAKRIRCYLNNSTDKTTLLKNCPEPCPERLNCGHKCTGTCGECVQSRFHKRCMEKCGVPLVCNHECPVPCREACKPCTRPCEIRCVHSKCKKKCGEPCTPCKAKCLRFCTHQSCTRKCGEICSVPPCDKKCSRKLKCGHPCVGFCGEPCPPLCRICNKEELTQIFFGSEDEDDAIFVLLNDCKHVVEHSGLKRWLNEADNQIQFKNCPKCKSNIYTTQRYSEYIRSAVKDVISAKIISFGHQDQNEQLRRKLYDQLTYYRVRNLEGANAYSYLDTLLINCPDLTEAIKILQKRLELVRDMRRQSLNRMQLNAIKSKIQTIQSMINSFTQNKHKVQKSDLSKTHLSFLLKLIISNEDHTSDQEINDLELEIKRLHRIVQFDNIKQTDKYKYGIVNSPEVKALVKDIQQDVYVDKRYNDCLDKALKNNLEELVKKLDCQVFITDKEKLEIVRAMGFAKGHWYKCPNGHPYAIGDCGGANQIGTCNECKAPIGGTGHRLLPDNQLAGEIDGATRHAWPGALY